MRKLLALTVIISLFTVVSFAQPGAFDPTFNQATGQFGFITELSTAPRLVSQPDGKLLIVGVTGTIDGVVLNNLARLKQDGKPDPSFNCPLTGPGLVALQPDGKVLVTGNYALNGGAVPILRVNTNGSLDNSFMFSPNSVPANSQATRIHVLPDGKILLWTTVNNTNYRLMRLNADGTVDNTFATFVTTTNWASAVQVDGKILVVSGGILSRLNYDGSVDASFSSGTVTGPPGNYIASVEVLPSGDILVAGTFNTYNGVARTNIAKIDTNGTLYSTYNPNIAAPITKITLQSSGKAILTAPYTRLLVRLNQDGTVDNTFLLPASLQAIQPVTVVDILAQPDGGLASTIVFRRSNGTDAYIVVRTNEDGRILYNGPNSTVTAALVQPDDKIIIAGGFTYYNDAQRAAIQRLNPDGSLDLSFNLSAAALNAIAGAITLALQADGKILVATSNGKVARLNTDGTLDGSFLFTVNGFMGIYMMTIQTDGKVVIGGQSRTGTQPIMRLNPNGSVDNSFNVGTGPTLGATVGVITGALVQPDGKLFVMGTFDTFNGVPRNHVVRLNPDGTIDPTFLNSNWMMSPYPDKCALQPNGKILISGIGFIIRLNSNGLNDDSFVGAYGGGGLCVQPDGKILVGGVGGPYRLNTDGSPDPTFNMGMGARPLTLYPSIGIPQAINTIIQQSTGKVIAGGDFYTYNNFPKRNLVRLLNCNASVSVSATSNAICVGSPTTLSATGAATYVWAPATGLSATTGASVTASPSTTTTYTVTGTDIYGCIASATITITVNPLPVIAITPPNPSYCVGGSATLTASGATNYTWSPAYGLSATTGSSVTTISTIPVQYTVVGVDVNGCQNIGSVTVLPNPIPTVTATPSIAYVCQSGSGTILQAFGADYYTWSPSIGLSSSTGNIVNATPTSTTTYTIAGTTAAGCSASTSVIAVPVSTSGTITATTRNLCKQAYANLSADVGSGYHWSTGETTQTIMVTYPGIFSVSYTNMYGCQVSASISITKSGTNCGRFRMIPSDSTAADTIFGDEPDYPFGISPNPATTEVRVTLSEPAKDESPIKIYDMLGRERKSNSIPVGQTELVVGISDLESGAFIVVVKDYKSFRQRILFVQRK